MCKGTQVVEGQSDCLRSRLRLRPSLCVSDAAHPAEGMFEGTSVDLRLSL